MREQRSGKREILEWEGILLQGFPGIVPQEGINRSGIGKKIQG